MASQYLSQGNHELVAAFLLSPLWTDIKICLMERRPPAGLATDDTHVAAAKGHIRNGYEMTIFELEKLPLDHDQTQQPDPFQRPALDTRD